jgi:hypothetical protein
MSTSRAAPGHLIKYVRLASWSYASTLLIVGLAREDMLVEIDCIAYIGD